MCFKTKPSILNTLQGESSNTQESDPDERVFLGTLTEEQCQDKNNCESENDNIQLQGHGNKAIVEMQLIAKP